MVENRDRQKTNSITHLVKIVAEEVVKKHNFLPSGVFTMQKLSERVRKLEIKMERDPDISGFVNGVVNDLERAGMSWTEAEDRKFNAELKVVLTHLARSHQRTLGSIKSRLYQKGLTRMDCS